MGDVTAHYASLSHEANVKAKRPMDLSWGVVTADRGVSAAVACPAPSQQIAKPSTAHVKSEPETEGAAVGTQEETHIPHCRKGKSGFAPMSKHGTIYRYIRNVFQSE